MAGWDWRYPNQAPCSAPRALLDPVKCSCLPALLFLIFERGACVPPLGTDDLLKQWEQHVLYT